MSRHTRTTPSDGGTRATRWLSALLAATWLVTTAVAVRAGELALGTSLLLTDELTTPVLRLGIVPTFLTDDGVPYGGVAGGELWRVVTGHLLHLDLLHLAGNVVALVVLGGAWERRVGALGLLVTFTAGCLGGALLVLLVSPPWTVVVGASGGVFGILAALVASALRGHRPGTLAVVVGSAYVAGAVLLPNNDAIHLGGLVGGGLVGVALAARSGRGARGGRTAP